MDTIKARWWIERDYLELKQELGLGHYEGRNGRGFHHHASLCIAAYSLLMLERLRSKKAQFGSTGYSPATGRGGIRLPLPYPNGKLFNVVDS